MPFRRRSIAALLPLCLAACQSAPGSAPRLELTLVLLKTGPRAQPLSDAESKQVFGGHFGNMQKLARERQLLLAGPYGAQKSDPRLRGLFVLDTADPVRARQLAETDPGFQAGVFALEYHTLSTAAPLRAVLAAELADQEAARAAGRTLSPGDGCRNYVLLTVEDGAAAQRELAGHPSVLWLAQLDGTRALVLLDAVDRVAAQALVQPLLQQLGAIRLDEWFASGHLADLPRPSGG